MRILALFGILLLSMVLDVAIFPSLAFLGVAPDMLLCITVSFALLEGSFNGAMMGLCGGLLIDLVCGGSLGFYALQYLIVGYVAGLPRGRFYVDKFLLPSLFAAIFYGIKSVLLLLLLFVSGSDSSMLLIIVRFVPLGALLSALLMLPVHALNRRLHKTRVLRLRGNREHNLFV
jgi:rod shape-determining protein MreD